MLEIEQIISNFEKDGAVCIRNLIDDHWIEKLKEGVKLSLDNPGPCSERLRGKVGTGYYFNDYFNWKKIPQFYDFIYNSSMAELAAKIMGSKESVFYHEHVLVKDPNTDKETPWHHDQAYYPIDGEKNCSFWIPLDRVPCETTIKFVAGSHKWKKLFISKKFSSGSNYVEYDSLNGEYQQIPEINENIHKILKWDVEPGDVVVFHMKTIHGAPANTSESLGRRVVSFRWLGDDAVMTTRPWDISPPEMGNLKPGDRAISEEFLRIWPKCEIQKLL